MLFSVFFSVILPIFILIGVGALVDRMFHLDIPTLSKLNFYAFVPALTFIKILDADISLGKMLTIGLFSLAHMAILFLVSWFMMAGPGLRERRVVLSQCAIFFNSGNYGIPLVLLAFGNGSIGILAVIILIQNLVGFSFGIWLFEKAERSAGQVLLGLVKIPIMHSIVLGLLLRYLHMGIINQIRIPVTYLADGIIPLALIALGAQLSRTKISENVKPIVIIGGLRLFFSPLLAALLVLAFGFTGHTASVLIVTAGLPVAVNVYLLAAEYRRDEGLASQTIFWTTLLSAFTITALLVIFR